MLPLLALHENVARLAAAALLRLVEFSAENRRGIVEKGGIELLLKVLKFHSNHPDFVALGLKVLHVLALDHATLLGEGPAGQPHSIAHKVLNAWFELDAATGEPFLQYL